MHKKMDQDIKDDFKKGVEKFVNYSICLDETMEIKNNLLPLKSMHKTTPGKDLLQKLLQALGKFNFPLGKLCGITIDGAPATVGKHTGMLSLLKKVVDEKEITLDTLIFLIVLFTSKAFVDNT